jgi:hypothetical protein
MAHPFANDAVEDAHLASPFGGTTVSAAVAARVFIGTVTGWKIARGARGRHERRGRGAARPRQIELLHFAEVAISFGQAHDVRVKSVRFQAELDEIEVA